MMKKGISFMMLLCTVFLLVGCGAESNAENLALYAEEQFMANDYEEYIKNLREKSGLSDLGIELHVVYSFEYDYDKDNKELFAEGHLTFTSDEIDNYYTEGRKNEELKDLARVLNKLKSAYYENPRYKYTNDKGTVILEVSNGVSDKFTVTTSSGREYEFSYYVNYDDIEVDGELVYMEKARDDDYSSSTSNSYTGAYDAKLKYSGTDGVLICVSEDAMERFMTAVNNGNEGTLDELFLDGQCAYTEQGTKCNIVDRKLTKCKVKLLDGSYAGNTVWVVIEAVQEE